MDVNDDAGCLSARGVWAFFASELAPTEGVSYIGARITKIP